MKCNQTKFHYRTRCMMNKTSNTNQTHFRKCVKSKQISMIKAETLPKEGLGNIAARKRRVKRQRVKVTSEGWSVLTQLRHLVLIPSLLRMMLFTHKNRTSRRPEISFPKVWVQRISRRILRWRPRRSRGLKALAESQSRNMMSIRMTKTLVCCRRPSTICRLSTSTSRAHSETRTRWSRSWESRH